VYANTGSLEELHLFMNAVVALAREKNL
jgi:hypothetical protein